MLLVMPRPQMLLSLRYTSVVSLFGLLSALNLCRHYLINLSLKDKKMIKKFPVLKCQSRFFGLCKIYTISIPEKDIEDEVKAFQKNMSTALKKEWYITFHTSENAIVVFREKIFVMSCKGIVPVYKKRIDTSHAKDKQRWDDMIQYAKSLGVPDEQCDFLPEDFTKQEY